MSTIDDLKKKRQSLQDQLSQVESSLRDAIIAECPWKVGDRIKPIGGRHDGKILECTRIRVDYTFRADPKFFPLKKDGTPAIVGEVDLYWVKQYERVEREGGAA